MWVCFFVESVKSTRGEEATDSRINEIIGQWFRQGPDRKGGSSSRKKTIKDKNVAQTNTEEESGTDGPGIVNENSASGTAD